MAALKHSQETPIHGDILEVVFSHVPLVHLLPACHVSKSWKRAVFSSLTHINPIKPWLMILTQCPRDPHVMTIHAYDPRSHVCVEIKQKPSMAIKHASAVRSSHSTVMYTLSPAEFAFSIDPLHLKWHHAPAPNVCRTDPIVARVGNLIVIAVAGDTMYLTEKYSGMTYTFNPIDNLWNGPYDLRPDQSVMFCVTGTLGKRLAVAGIVGEGENVKGMKIWVVKGELGSGIVMEELGEMPEEMVEKVMGGSEFGLGSVVVTWVGEFMYVANPVQGEEVVVCEVVNGGTCEWLSVKNACMNEGTRMKRVVLSGVDVCFQNLQRELGICMKVM
ncbi:putative F-box domain, kelch-type beta propeller [Lupinus albus]|uniref:Putative F-box domain, kelch-type beta propeller n=1 Tax=Lupinus albus TaxID=3870 RepID=A0A6A4PZU0_LUPAL|nr:putative F-box domain, kelch-type beta propeller [Lupinus albus]